MSLKKKNELMVYLNIRGLIHEFNTEYYGILCANPKSEIALRFTSVETLLSRSWLVLFS